MISATPSYTVLSRPARSALGTRTQPLAMYSIRPLRNTCTTPKPVMREPGSIPNIRITNHSPSPSQGEGKGWGSDGWVVAERDASPPPPPTSTPSSWRRRGGGGVVQGRGVVWVVAERDASHPHPHSFPLSGGRRRAVRATRDYVRSASARLLEKRVWTILPGAELDARSAPARGRAKDGARQNRHWQSHPKEVTHQLACLSNSSGKSAFEYTLCTSSRSSSASRSLSSFSASSPMTGVEVVARRCISASSGLRPRFPMASSTA